ncbi:hypothetical protein JOD43_000581 [Pullulanibacillus pueri]|uniref:Putative lipoprotein YutC n=1 Tax=Pullulanibacillus pueri TaxID=1437324 RepID=A0A8J2ZTE6_9BACL|nr:YhcN/YlaJ family sporulation lipoprotein [Pullulanibacillus pueri]MBM7680422.1 hypothetical protein [Pullulanibacillus pueri]GGH75164.1 putative lipoprotein YutC [Pullulanibacillus pueri]
MKKLLITALMTVLTVAGCGLDTHNNHNSSGLKRMQDPTEDVTYKGPSQNIKSHEESDAADGQFGFVHYSRKQGDEHALTAQHMPKMDYKATADIITRQELSLPDIYDAATLVTDEYVLIGYKTTNENRDESASQVRQAALAVIPNYYKVVISDADYASSDIARYKDFNSKTTGVQSWLQNMIDEMQKSPQGYANKKDTNMNVKDEKEQSRTEGNDKYKNEETSNEG